MDQPIDRAAASFPMAEARLIARRFSEPNAKIYWPDFLVSGALGWSASEERKP